MLPPMSLENGPTLIAFDGSPAARQAVAVAANLLQPRSTLVLTVWEPALAHAAAAPAPHATARPTADLSAGLDVDSELRRNAEEVSRQGAELARSLGLDAEPIATPDVRDVPHTIVELARRHDAATIVVGSRGLSGLRARLEGSTAKDVVKQASCPVIVVHDAAEAD
jgi:nucleotide-binding universal stress UspA family protein